MALETTLNRKEYSGNGVTTGFAFPYYFLEQADLVVILKNNTTGASVTQVLTTNYTVAGEGVEAGGTVTMLIAPPSGYTLIIYRDAAIIQDKDFRENDSFPAEQAEEAWDRAAMISQRLAERIDRSLRVAESFLLSSFSLDLPVDLAAVGSEGKVLVVNATRDAFIMGPTADDISNAQAYAAAAAASEAAAATSETNAANSAASALASATSATTSATSATASATSATASATSATASATSATASAASATTSAATATTQAGNASTSATAAAASQTAAATSATNAASSATAAATSATNAGTSETNASASATAAAASAAANIWRDVVFLTFADSPRTILAAERGKLFAVDTSGGAVVINLPQISTLSLTSAFTIGIKKTSADANTITINRAGTDTIDGATTKSISVTGSGSTFIPDTDPSPDTWTTADFGASAGNLTRDKFSGTGAQTAFTLSVSPATKNNTFVYVEGVYQAKDTYSVSGTTLTFTEAPPTGTDNVEVISGTLLSIGTPGDATVTDIKTSFTPPTIQKFTSSSGTYTRPATAKYIRVRMVGGGGGGACSGNLGTGTNGGNGGNTTFGSSLLAAGGGTGGTGSAASDGSGGAGGTASLGTGPIGTAIAGGKGQTGGYNVSGTTNGVPGGIGGNSPFGGAGTSNYNAVGAAAVANSGSGGAGGFAPNTAAIIVGGGGGGAGGFIDAIITSPSATYAYAVGAAGTAGSGGTQGYSGTAGGSGYIEVTEYYQ